MMMRDTAWGVNVHLKKWQGWRNRTEEEQLAGIEMLRERRLWRATESL